MTADREVHLSLARIQLNSTVTPECRPALTPKRFEQKPRALQDSRASWMAAMLHCALNCATCMHKRNVCAMHIPACPVNGEPCGPTLQQPVVPGKYRHAQEWCDSACTTSSTIATHLTSACARVFELQTHLRGQLV